VPSTLPYRTVDVFSDRRFGGNPLAVLPDARGLSDDDMQRIAAEFGYSETTFVLPPSDPANSARVRIFTPASELPFAGHPNVGTAFVLASEGVLFGRSLDDELRFEEGAGLVEALLLREGDRVVGAEIRAPASLEVGAPIDVATVAACGSLPEGAITTIHHPPITASVGLPFVLAEIVSVDALGRAAPDTTRFAEATARLALDGDRFALLLYAHVPERPDRLRARMFAPLYGVAEDPATGSAAAALGAYLAAIQPEPDLETEISIAQGDEVGRPSVIEVRVVKRAGVVRDVFVAGRCVDVMRGTLTLSDAT
jgi:trans-2,3-dihydro-3-hydroxyanthranilate isomerase